MANLKWHKQAIFYFGVVSNKIINDKKEGDEGAIKWIKELGNVKRKAGKKRHLENKRGERKKKNVRLDYFGPEKTKFFFLEFDVWTTFRLRINSAKKQHYEPIQ